jgi:hypothetical protein
MITGIGMQLPSAPGDTRSNRGFPWTTGKVIVSNQDATPTTLTATGSDMRTQAGAAQITMVACGMPHRIASGANFMPMEVVTFTLPEPGSALMLGVSLSLIFALYRVSRRP